MKLKINSDTKFRLRVYCLNNTEGWTEYANLAELKAGLDAEEAKCREWATTYAAENPNDFRNEDEDRPQTEDEISDWINDCADENGNKPASDVAVFAPDVEAWIVDEDGDGSWETIEVDDLP